MAEMEYVVDRVALTFAILGFTFGLIAFSLVNQVKKAVQQLRNQLEGD